MGFSFGEITEKTEHGLLKGTRYEIACECYYTAGGKSIPRWFKIRTPGEDGEIRIIRHVELICSEPKNYCGIETVEHICRILIEEKELLVKLIYTKESCKWALIVI